ncbi:MAG: 4Fe-4S dicluster domain-containing protein [Candidatus Hodarchaeales archaeon]|jgi:ferredoxin
MLNYSENQTTAETIDKKLFSRAPVIDTSLCIKCHMCIEVCPQDVFNQDVNGYYRVQNPGDCIECGACELNCRSKAIIFDPFPGCGCIWNATSRRIRKLLAWRQSQSNSSCCSENST